MTVTPNRPLVSPRLAVELADPSTLNAHLARPDTLAVFGFGTAAPSTAQIGDPRYLRVDLQPLDRPRLEVWRSEGPVRTTNVDGLQLSDDGHLQFGWLEVEEGEGGILQASAQAYAQLSQFWVQSDYPHLLRIWNYFSDIVDGEDDAERYRQFCVGRVRGLGVVNTASLPAATAIGTRAERRVLQVYWLAAREAGQPLENPRQVSAWQYPRQYGPQSPSFARALLPPAHFKLPLMLSGTASIVGHASRHIDSLPAQLDETLANLHSLVDAARQHRPTLSAEFNTSSRLKVYVRDAEDAALISQQIDQRLGSDVPRLLLLADVCRRELRVEIEGMHGV